MRKKFFASEVRSKSYLGYRGPRYHTGLLEVTGDVDTLRKIAIYLFTESFAERLGADNLLADAESPRSRAINPHIFEHEWSGQ